MSITCSCKKAECSLFSCRVETLAIARNVEDLAAAKITPIIPMKSPHCHMKDLLLRLLPSWHLLHPLWVVDWWVRDYIIMRYINKCNIYCFIILEILSEFNFVLFWFCSQHHQKSFLLICPRTSTSILPLLRNCVVNWIPLESRLALRLNLGMLPSSKTPHSMLLLENISLWSRLHQASTFKMNNNYLETLD